MSFNWPWVPSDVKQYRRYRKAGRDLNQKIIEALVDESIIEKSARALNLGKNHNLVLDSEDDLSVLMDFALYEIPQNGGNLVQQYQTTPGGSNFIERDLLASMAKAQTGLFQVNKVSSHSHSLELRGIDDKRALTLTDINLSQSMIAGPVMFFRPIELATFTMTSGVAFVFPGAMQQQLLTLWVAAQPAERYARFAKLHKSKGVATQFV